MAASLASHRDLYEENPAVKIPWSRGDNPRKPPDCTFQYRYRTALKVDTLITCHGHTVGSQAYRKSGEGKYVVRTPRWEPKPIANYCEGHKEHNGMGAR